MSHDSPSSPPASPGDAAAGVGAHGETAKAHAPKPGHVSAVDGVALPCFDGLRGVALILVFGYHALAQFRGAELSPTVKDWLLHSGTTALTMFFVISGCLLYRPFVVAELQSRPPPRAFPFLKRRVCRIFPGYWFALALAIYVFGVLPRPDADDFATLFGLVQNYRVGYLKAGLNVSWTLVIEVVYYVTLPLIAAGVRALTPRGASLGSKVAVQLACLLAMYFAAHGARAYLLWGEAPPPPGEFGSWFGWRRIVEYPFTYYDWLALGMVLAVASAWVSTNDRGSDALPRLVAALGRSPATCWAIGLVFYASIALLGIHYGTPESPAQEMGLKFLQGLSALFLVLPGVVGRQSEGPIRALLLSRPMVFLGTVSYGVYLWHLVVLKRVYEWVTAGRLPDHFAVELVAATTLTLVAASVSWYAVEQPMIRWAQKRPQRAA